MQCLLSAVHCSSYRALNILLPQLTVRPTTFQLSTMAVATAATTTTATTSRAWGPVALSPQPTLLSSHRHVDPPAMVSW